MSQINYEDLIMKRSLDLFSHECLEYLNIHRKIKSTVQTELVTLDIKNMHMDYNFLTEDNVILHFEFQTTIEIIDNTERTGEQELVEDMMQIVTVFSVGLQGKRSHKAKKMIKELLENDTCEKS